MAADPDRFFDLPTPGAQEWWYFDAISDDERDALVLIWYSGLPFDPEYGRAIDRHLRDPGRHPAPRGRDFPAIGLSWYRDGEPLAYALNAYPPDQFHHQAEPFALDVAGSRIDRERDGSYRLRVNTPAVDGRHQLVADLRFRPAARTVAVERNLGTVAEPHHWILVAPDCQVDGTVAQEGRRPERLTFRGRGYHDHNAGSEEISRAMRRWLWGRVHHGPLTQVFYQAEPQVGSPTSLWITCRDGAAEAVRENVPLAGARPKLGPFGLRSWESAIAGDQDGSQLEWRHTTCVDDGPFYRRWLARFGADLPSAQSALGITEQLEPRRLHHPIVRWMIPYRLKRPV